jgi:hypothetical protein
MRSWVAPMCALWTSEAGSPSTEKCARTSTMGILEKFEPGSIFVAGPP